MYGVKLVAETGAQALPPGGTTWLVCVAASSAKDLVGKVASTIEKTTVARTKRSS